MDGDDLWCTTNSTVDGTGQWAFWVMVSIYVTVLFFTVAVLSLVIAAKTVPGHIRFVLVNILVASTTACIGIGLLTLRVLVFAISHQFSSTDLSFVVFLAIASIGESGSSAFMAVFAVVVVIIIKCSNSAVKFKYLVISVLVVWIASVAVGLLLVVPGILKVQPYGCSDVFFLAGPNIWIFAVLYFLFFAVAPFTVATVMPVYALCYIRANTVHENAASLKPMLKFVLFLLIGNVLSFMGQSVATAGSLITKHSGIDDDEVLRMLMCIYNILIGLSTVPTPILILVYFKPVRVQMRKCLMGIGSKCCRKHVAMSEQIPLTDMMLAAPAVDNDLNV